jgi:pimeloyl-ACP methyl ester carboxylesterase
MVNAIASPPPLWPPARFAVSLLLAFYGLSLPCLLPFACVVAFGSETVKGVLLGLAMLLGLAQPPMAIVARWKRWRARVGYLPTGAALAIVAVLAATQPSGRAPEGARLRSSGLTPGARAGGWIANLVPEVDQVKIGLAVVPWIDPLLDRSRAERVSALALPLYREMRRHAEVEALGSALGEAYAGILGGSIGAGHYYEYVPEASPGRPQRVLLFLHGGGGNFRAYVWAWKPFADREGVRILCPTYGLGNWHEGEAQRWIEGMLARAGGDCGAVLAALSNGGSGACLAAARNPGAWRGLVLISPVIRPEAVAELGAAWAGRPVLIFHGRRDERVPFAQVAEAAEQWRARGLRVSLREFAEEDHFLLFARLAEVQEEIGRWWP